MVANNFIKRATSPRNRFSKKRCMVLFILVVFTYSLGFLLFMSYDMDPIVPARARKISIEIVETAEMKDNGVSALRNLVASDENLNVPLDDAFMLRFLRKAMFDAKKAFDLLRRYYAFPVLYPEYFDNDLPSNFYDMYRANIAGYLNDEDYVGRQILFFKISNWNTSVFTPPDLFKIMHMSTEWAIANDEETQTSGIPAIFDLKDMTFQHVLTFSISIARVWSCYTQRCFPGSPDAIHIVNQPYLFNLACNLLYRFMSPQLKEKVYIHGTNYTILHEYFNPDILPQEVGGTKGPFNNKEHLKHLLLWEPTWEKYRSYGYKVKFNNTLPPVEVCSEED